MKLLEKFKLLKELIIWYLIYLKDLKILFGKEFGLYKNRVTFPGVSKSYIKFYKERLKQKVPTQEFSYSEKFLYWINSLPEKIKTEKGDGNLCVTKALDNGTMIYRAGYRRDDGVWVYNIPSKDPLKSIHELYFLLKRQK